MVESGLWDAGLPPGVPRSGSLVIASEPAAQPTGRAARGYRGASTPATLSPAPAPEVPPTPTLPTAPRLRRALPAPRRAPAEQRPVRPSPGPRVKRPPIREPREPREKLPEREPRAPRPARPPREARPQRASRAPRLPRPARAARPPRPARRPRPPRAPRRPRTPYTKRTKGLKQCKSGPPRADCRPVKPCVAGAEIPEPNVRHSSCNWQPVDSCGECVPLPCTGPFAGALQFIIELLPKGWFALPTPKPSTPPKPRTAPRGGPRLPTPLGAPGPGELPPRATAAGIAAKCRAGWACQDWPGWIICPNCRGSHRCGCGTAPVPVPASACNC